MDDDSVDVCISYTVIEHVPNLEFILEQKRVCKKGGRIIVMSVLPDKSITIQPEGISEMAEREKELWMPIDKAFTESDKMKKVGAYSLGPRDFPILLQKAGLKNIRIDALALPVVIDNSDNSEEEKRRILEAERALALEGLEISQRLLDKPLPEDHIQEIKNLANTKYEKRLELFHSGVKIWDMNIYMTFIAIGEK